MSADVMKYNNLMTPKSERRKFGVGDILVNGAVCLKCGEFIRSKHRQDFVSCSCRSVSVDGGSWYTKRSFNDSKDFVDVIIMFEDVNDKT